MIAQSHSRTPNTCLRVCLIFDKYSMGHYKAAETGEGGFIGPRAPLRSRLMTSGLAAWTFVPIQPIPVKRLLPIPVEPMWGAPNTAVRLGVRCPDMKHPTKTASDNTRRNRTSYEDSQWQHLRRAYRNSHLTIIRLSLNSPNVYLTAINCI